MALATVSYFLKDIFLKHSAHWIRAYALASQGSWVNAVVNGLFQVAFFAGYSIPELSGHMSDKYKSQWTVSFKGPSLLSATRR
jgi:hypothetical protein